MSNSHKFSPRLMLTQQTFDGCCFNSHLSSKQNIYSIHSAICAWIFIGVQTLLSGVSVYRAELDSTFHYITPFVCNERTLWSLYNTLNTICIKSSSLYMRSSFETHHQYYLHLVALYFLHYQHFHLQLL